MKSPIEFFRDHFNDVVESVECFAFFVRASEFQEDNIKRLERLLTECLQKKEQAISEQSDDAANAFLAFEFMAKAFAEEFRFYLALKADDPDSAWDHLVNAQSLAAFAMKTHSVASHLDEVIQRLYAFERFLFPKPLFFSSGFIVRESECNICGAEYGECTHIKGRPYMGKLCARIVKEAELREISAVSDPGDKHCRALYYTENGLTKNVFTQRIVADKVAPQSSPADPDGPSDMSSGSAET